MSWTWPLGWGFGAEGSHKSITLQSQVGDGSSEGWAWKASWRRHPGGKARRVKSMGICWETGEGDSAWGGLKAASHLVLSPLLPEVHLIVQIWLGHTRRQLVRSIDDQDLLCLVEHQDRRGWLHWRTQNGACQGLPRATEHADPCLQAGLPLTQRADS